MRCKVLAIICALLVFLMGITSVVGISKVEYTSIKNSITPLETATYSLLVKNEGKVKASYKVYSLEVGWLIDPPPQDRTFTLLPGESYTTTISVRPAEPFKPGVYAPTLFVDEYIGQSYTSHPVDLKLYLSPEGDVSYFPSFKVEIDMNEKINPRDSQSIKLFLENRNPLNLKDLKVIIQSDIPAFQKELKVNIPPLEKKTVEFSIIPNKFQQPKEYTLFFVFEHQGEQVKIIPQTIEILPLLPDFTVVAKEETIFLKKFSSLSVSNPGNVRNTQNVQIPISFWSSLFVQGAESIKKIDGQRYLLWETTLSPEEEVTIFYVTNHRVLFYVIVLLLVFGVLYAVVRSPLLVSKKAIASHGVDHDTLSEIKITIEVRNRTDHPVENVVVTDIVPSIANVEKSLELGTVKPEEVRNTKKGTQVIWSLPELDAREYRLITYKIKAKLNILGTFSLPRAAVEFKKGKGKRKTYSNIFRLGV